ncbi:diguanylate cyclase [Moraxella macacae 0408225]|uniref:diguanylate cyclase n=1 Tax=Moraxella macacae 0408225 TaxID=1230338 RepID=L2F5Y5_9GAMM|nr:GGDEF domain-containing protein [Moraxella macacae]ELA08181.1 diguanylate cyclase [Moraxella macacae 0408225]
MPSLTTQTHLVHTDTPLGFWQRLAMVFDLFPNKYPANQYNLKATETDKFILFILLTMAELALHGSWYAFMLSSKSQNIIGIGNIVVDDVMLSLAMFALALFSLSILAIAGVLNIPENTARWFWVQGSYVLMYLFYGLLFTLAIGENTSAVGIMFLGSMVLGLFLLRWRFILTAYLLCVAALLFFLANQHFQYFRSVPSFYPTENLYGTPIWQLSYLYLALPKVTLTVLAVAQVLRVLEKQEQSIYRLSEVDALTGAYNRRSVYAFFNHLWAYRDWQVTSVIYFDLDKFKNINDTYGHPIGDKVLIQAVQAVKTVLPKQAVLGRLGGEEFLVILPNSEQHEAQTFAEKIRHAIANSPITLTEKAHIKANQGRHQLIVTTSLGAGSVYRIGETLANPQKPSFLRYLRQQTAPNLGLPIAFEKLIHRTDDAMYQAKTTGRNRLVLAKPMRFYDNA